MDSARAEGQGTTNPSGSARVVSRTCEVPDVSFRSVLADGAPPRVHWTSPDGLEILGLDAAARLVAEGATRFEDLIRRAQSVLSDVDHRGPAAARPRFHGGAAFVPDHEARGPWEGFPAASFVLPRTTLVRAGDSTYLTETVVDAEATGEHVERRLEDRRASVTDHPRMQPIGDPPGVLGTERTTTRAEWLDHVRRAVDRIRSGDLRKVVLAQSLRVDLASELAIPNVLERLRRTYPNCYRFLFQPADGAGFFGAPPERLVRLEGRRVETEALAGSVERGATPAEDADLAESLLESEKLQEEQGLVVDAIRDALSSLGEVGVGEQSVRKLTNIQHLQTPITADLEAETHVLSVVRALHPTPAVGGMPRETALSFIRETETFDRGWYAAPIGWFDADGNGEFAVAIRSAVADRRRARLFAGNGIVADSDPEEEWAEIGPKYRPILDELQRDDEG